MCYAVVWMSVKDRCLIELTEIAKSRVRRPCDSIQSWSVKWNILLGSVEERREGNGSLGELKNYPVPFFKTLLSCMNTRRKECGGWGISISCHGLITFYKVFKMLWWQVSRKSCLALLHRSRKMRQHTSSRRELGMNWLSLIFAETTAGGEK